MNLQYLLFFGFSGSILSWLTDALAGDVQLVLDGNQVHDLSTHASGKRAFVVKAWLDPQEGPALRFRASWGSLEHGRLWWQEQPAGPWIPADIHGIEIVEGLAELTLRIEFSVNMDQQHSLLLIGPSLPR